VAAATIFYLAAKCFCFNNEVKRSSQEDSRKAVCCLTARRSKNAAKKPKAFFVIILAGLRSQQAGRCLSAVPNRKTNRTNCSQASSSILCATCCAVGAWLIINLRYAPVKFLSSRGQAAAPCRA